MINKIEDKKSLKIAPKSFIKSSLQLSQQVMSGKYWNDYKRKHLSFYFILEM